MSIKNINTDKISKAIDDFEREVDFEFIPVVTPKSSYVEHISWVISLFILLAFITFIDFFFQDSYASKTPYYIAAPFLAVGLGILLDKLDFVDRFFISKAERNRQVHEKAERLFFRKKLHESKSQNAILLLISVMERRIVIFPDPRHKLENLKELNEKVLSILKKSFRQNEYEQGLLTAIEYLKSELIKKHKKTSQNTENQFSNKLIWWND